MSLSLRELDAADPGLSLLSRWRAEAFFQDYDRSAEADEADLRVLISEGWPVLRADWDGTPAGTALLSPEELDQRHDVSPWFCGLYVMAEFRRRGIATALLAACERAAAALGHARLHLYSHVAEGFYLARGWRTLDRFDDEGAEAVLMARDLAP